GNEWLRVRWMGTQGFVWAVLLQEVDAGEIAAWNKVKGSKKAGDVATFLKFYPNGYYAGRATALLTDLRNSAPANPTPPAAREGASTGKPQTSLTLLGTEELLGAKSQGAPSNVTKPSAPPSTGSMPNPISSLPVPASPSLAPQSAGFSGHWVADFIGACKY